MGRGAVLQEHYPTGKGSPGADNLGRRGPVRYLMYEAPGRETPRTTSDEDFAGGDGDLGQNWWFLLDPGARYLVSGDGALLLANPAGHTAIENGKLALTNAGALKFGSTDSDSRFHAALLQVAGHHASTFAILRQRQGGWLAADFHSVPGNTFVLLAFRAELAPSPEAMAAISGAFQLTRSESEVLHRLLDGDCPKTAANRLHISEHTVRAHLRSIYAKMGVRGLVNTIRMACAFL